MYCGLCFTSLMKWSRTLHVCSELVGSNGSMSLSEPRTRVLIRMRPKSLGIQIWRNLELASDRGRIVVLDVQTIRGGGEVGSRASSLWFAPGRIDWEILLSTSLGNSSSMLVMGDVRDATTGKVRKGRNDCLRKEGPIPVQSPKSGVRSDSEFLTYSNEDMYVERKVPQAIYHSMSGQPKSIHHQVYLFLPLHTNDHSLFETSPMTV